MWFRTRPQSKYLPKKQYLDSSKALRRILGLLLRSYLKLGRELILTFQERPLLHGGIRSFSQLGNWIIPNRSTINLECVLKMIWLYLVDLHRQDCTSYLPMWQSTALVENRVYLQHRQVHYWTNLYIQTTRLLK